MLMMSWSRTFIPDFLEPAGHQVLQGPCLPGSVSRTVNIRRAKALIKAGPAFRMPSDGSVRPEFVRVRDAMVFSRGNDQRKRGALA
jgi:hypothetical protein